MIKVQALKDFSLTRYYEIKNLVPRMRKKEGIIYRDDIFECSIDLARYLLGANEKGIIAVKILEVIPN